MHLSKPIIQNDPTETVFLDRINNKSIYLKKDYLNDKEVQGNKLRKLKYNLSKALENDLAIVSFGGAYSNHIAALAAVCDRYHIPCLAMIRGEELKQIERWSHTLHTAHKKNMELCFVSRKAYREKQHSEEIAHLIAEYQSSQNKAVMVIPEGGSNDLAVLGCQEIVKEIIEDKMVETFNHLFCACGTAGTLAGLINGLYDFHLFDTQITGVSALKGANDFLNTQIRRLAKTEASEMIRWQVIENKTQTKYAKTNLVIQTFIHNFYQQYGIPLDDVYTAKLVYSVFELANHSSNQSENWLIYHSGGLQGSKTFLENT